MAPIPSLGAAAILVCVVLWPIAWGFGINLLRLIRYIGTELMIVFGTNSSESVFPRLHAKLRGSERRP